MSRTFLQVDWPAPPNIKALQTTRKSGLSKAPFSSFNIAMHVGDSVDSVTANRAHLPKNKDICWLNQVHSEVVIEADGNLETPSADASFTYGKNSVCAVMTADCLPVLICNEKGSFVAAIHAGWRGLATGIIENTIAKYKGENSGLLAWLGPAIGPDAFEVGADVVTQFPQHPDCVLESENQGKFLLNLYQVARQKLCSLGVNQIYGGEYCTFSQDELFFSYRRDGQTGRMASLVWIE